MKTKQLTIREQRRKQMQQQRLTTIMIVVGVSLIVVALLIAPSLQAALAPVGEITPAEAKTYPNPVANSMGDPNAPVTIIEFSDFQCPACQTFFNVTKDALVEEYVATGKVYFTYRSMGAWIGPESAQAAQAAYCAGDQGKFWEYHDILFVNQGAENSGNYSQKRLTAFAETIDLNMDTFNACLSSGKYQGQVTQDQADGRSVGVQGTPAFLINGKLVGGAINVETMRTEVEAALAATGN